MLIHKYKESWVKDFNQIRNVLHEALLDLRVSIEHIGSTAIPKLAAKQIIDIDVIHDRNTEFGEIKRRLEKIGYYHNGNQGIADREVFKRDKMIEKHEVLDFISHHLYVCPIDSKELERHILFRDYLIANEGARVQYQHLKFEMAEEVNQDRKKYTQLKEVKAKDFINNIIEKAKEDRTKDAAMPGSK
ncbi:GrpB family protein [Fulvivirgaceae bacterium BMA10]|uniref:GrpB family protein n=1 Tax=Splendidivirga corallicola TaxID=3051826 RepID=A0ABT8KQ01_9BACT|nr:GrpB family protein [Fulvivirgaceae bacterium BMA10]